MRTAAQRAHRAYLARVRRARDPERFKRAAESSYARRKEKMRAKYLAERKERIARQLAWNAANPDRKRENNRRHSSRNPAKRNAITARYHAAKINATPKWADFRAIEQFYKLAVSITSETGVPHEVDHVVPLQSKIVCGLHWEGNLQVITASENRRKSRIWLP